MQANDPWAHRSAGMRCKTCMWFVAKMPDAALGKGAAYNAPYNPALNTGDVGLQTAIGIAPQPPERVLGRCRRHAPTMNGFPAVWTDDWCGDHKLDETKVVY